MKKFIILFCLLILLPTFGCVQKESESLDTIPPVNTLPLPDQDFSQEDDSENEENAEEDSANGEDSGNGENNSDFEEEDKDTNNDNNDIFEEVKTKYYIVSTTNSLRVRTKPSSNSLVVGYLDRNDALVLIEKVGNYYKTTFKGKTAYVHASFVSLMEIEISNEKVEKAIDIGSTLMGYPYVWGSQRYHWGNGKLNTNFVDGEFDCSALTLYVYYHSDKIILDVTSRAQVNNGKEVKRNDLQRGDLMFFTNESRKNKVGDERIGHVGIYFGNNYILHTASDHAVIEPISNTRWGYYITARRVV